MRRFSLILGGLLVVVALPGAAEEIVHFKSGQTLPIISHEMRDGMVHVDLGENGFVAFPESAIDQITQAGKNVMIRPSYTTADGGQRVPTPEGHYMQAPITRSAGLEISPLAPDDEDNEIEIDERTGMAITRPMGHSPAANKRRFGVTGDMRVLGNNPIRRGNGSTTYGGTTPLGNRHVIGSLEPRRSTNATRRNDIPRPVSIKMRAGGPANAQAPKTDGQSKKSK